MREQTTRNQTVQSRAPRIAFKNSHQATDNRHKTYEKFEDTISRLLFGCSLLLDLGRSLLLRSADGVWSGCLRTQNFWETSLRSEKRLGHYPAPIARCDSGQMNPARPQFGVRLILEATLEQSQSKANAKPTLQQC